MPSVITPIASVAGLSGVLSSFVMNVEIASKSKSNHRHDKSSNWRSVKSFEGLLRANARAARPVDWPPLEPHLPLKERPLVVVGMVGATMLDAANLPKSVTDALEDVCCVTDASVRAVAALTQRTKKPVLSLALICCDPGALAAANISVEMGLADLVSHAIVAATAAFGIAVADYDASRA